MSSLNVLPSLLSAGPKGTPPESRRSSARVGARQSGFSLLAGTLRLPNLLLARNIFHLTETGWNGRIAPCSLSRLSCTSGHCPFAQDSSLPTVGSSTETEPPNLKDRWRKVVLHDRLHLKLDQTTLLLLSFVDVLICKCFLVKANFRSIVETCELRCACRGVLGRQSCCRETGADCGHGEASQGGQWIQAANAAELV